MLSSKRKRRTATEYLDGEDWEDSPESDLEELHTEAGETGKEYNRELDEANDCNLLGDLLGEATSASHDHDTSSGGLPVRILTNFAVIDASSGEYISLDDVNAEGGSSAPIARGDVRPCYNEDDDNYSDIADQNSDASSEQGLEFPPLHLHVSSILSVYVDHTPKIMLQTMYAWYALDIPNAAYKRYYESSWIRQRLTALFCEIISRDDRVPRAIRHVDTLEKVRDMLQMHEDEGIGISDIGFEAQRIIGRQLAWADLKTHRDSVISNIRDLQENANHYGCSLNLGHPLFRALRDASFHVERMVLAQQAGFGILEDSSDDDNDDHDPQVRDNINGGTTGFTIEPANDLRLTYISQFGNQIGDDESREQTPQYDSENSIVERQSPRRSQALRPEPDPKPATRRTRRKRRIRGPQVVRHNELGLLRHFTRPRLPRLVRRNAAEFFEQVKKMGQQPNRTTSSPAPSTTRCDSSSSNPDRPEAVFGIAWPEGTVAPARTSATHPFSPPLVQCSDAAAPHISGLDFRPAARVGDIVYKPGDYVAVELLQACSGAENITNSPPAKSMNPYADTHRFARILHLRVDSGDQMAVHVLWLEHSSRRLEEGHHPRELFFTECCGTMHPRLLKCKIQVDIIDPLGSVPKYTSSSDPGQFFVRWLWDFSDSSIQSLPPLALPNTGMQLECLGCRKNLNDVERHTAKRWEISKGQTKYTALRFDDIEYHNGDFVYLSHPEQKDPRLSGIARIMDIGGDGSTIKVLRFKRCFGRIPESVSQRHLALFAKGGQDEWHGSAIDISRLAGKCQVIHTTAWVVRPDVSNGDIFGSEPHLYHADEIFTTPGPNPERQPLSPQLLTPCNICTEEKKQDEQRLRQKLPLILMDVFCGAGGMSQGLVRTGIAKAAYAVDISPSSCATYRTLHPGPPDFEPNNIVSDTPWIESRVICDDVNNVLNCAFTRHSQETNRFRTIFGKTVPDFPNRGDVDIVSLTPPCTGFSGLNRFKSAMDLRNTYIVSGLAMVEHLQPGYVIIENVVTMARFPLRARDSKNGRLVGGIKWGPHKFILRTLMDLGYQVRFGLLDAAHYGAPQTRRRMIYMAARQGLRLPLLPSPTHHSSSQFQKPLKASWGYVTMPATGHSFPHMQVTIRDAIGDLPRFDWHDPELQRNEWPAVRPRGDQRCGLPENGEFLGYRVECFTDYQRWTRGNHESVSHHYTMVFDEAVTKRVTQITMEPRSSHLSLPRRLEMNALVGTTGAAARQRLYPLCYGRLDERAQFQTIVSRCHPSHRQGEVLHPNQRRVLSVREWARAQGFTDRTEFKSTTNSEADRYRQIGNAIPVLLAMALARSFVKTLVYATPAF